MGGAGAGAMDTDGRDRVHRERWARLLCRRDEYIRLEVIALPELIGAEVKISAVPVWRRNAPAALNDPEQIDTVGVPDLV